MRSEPVHEHADLCSKAIPDMTRIIFLEPDGTRRGIDAVDGANLMQAAIDGGIAGILGDCGGCCSCATCHVYVDSVSSVCLPNASADERMTLECALDPKPNSRLACQLLSNPDLDGLVLRVPARQI
ncbi:MAG: 2Fe-2S iron-sulfur cluster-binding protein [Panacagrimonas sp.]